MDPDSMRTCLQGDFGAFDAAKVLLERAGEDDRTNGVQERGSGQKTGAVWNPSETDRQGGCRICGKQAL